MFVEQLKIRSFRHLRDIQLGSFREPINPSELIVLAGPNGGGKSSALELLSYGLTSRYSWQFYEARSMADHSYAIKIGLSENEIQELIRSEEELRLGGAAPRPDISSFLANNRGYWIEINYEVVQQPDMEANALIHNLVSRSYSNFSRKLGFFIRSERGYGQRGYDQRQIFTRSRRLANNYFNLISFKSASEQYNEIYDFLVEQSYDYIYQLGTNQKALRRGEVQDTPLDPIAPYDELLGRLFEGYKFVDVTDSDFSLRIKLPGGQIIQFHEMSSGEKEVFFILALFLRHNINNSIIVIDEPELHLHPELARKLIRLMRNVQPQNQIWCATHSAELIDEAGRERTYFFRASADRTRTECIPATAERAELKTREGNVKFMLTFAIKPQTNGRDEAIARFKRTGADMPKGAKLLGRWTAADFSGGFVLIESDDAAALTENSLRWSDLMEIRIAPVLEDGQLGEVLARAGL